MKNKSSAISIGAVILIFALTGLKTFLPNEYISSEQVAKSLTPVPILVYETVAESFSEKNISEKIFYDKILEQERRVDEGLILYRQGKYQESINFYTEYLKTDPYNEAAYNRRGNVYFLKFEQYDAAIDDYNRAIEVNPQYWKPYYNRGNVHTILQDYDAAISDYNRALELNPNDADIYESRGICYLQAGEIKKAFADFAKAQILD